jgi:geranylgeranyl diphosphate synthase, type II
MLHLESFLAEKQRVVELALEKHMPPVDERPRVLHEAMRYSVFAGGKRLRPILCLTVAEALGASPEKALLPAIALEVLHTYSLIHDDLPAMDDDSLRRGKPTSHIVFGEANAILAGDALLTLAFEWLAGCPAPEPYLPTQYALELAQASGHRGIIAGQVEDLAAEGQTPTADMVDYIHRHKTAALIRASVRMGAIAAGAPPSWLDALSLYGDYIGLAFQIADDVLNETSSPETLGKAVGSDQARNKATYAALHGIEKAKRMAVDLVEKAVVELKKVSRDTSVLVELARYIVSRDH